jgi:hypothetical protein
MKSALLAAALALGAAGSHAAPRDNNGAGLALYTPREVNAAEKTRLDEKGRQWGGFPATPISVNLDALNYEVINVTIDGKAYRFVGSKTASVNRVKANEDVMFDAIETWRGMTADGDTAEFEQSTSFWGRLDLDGQYYYVHHDALVKGTSWAPSVQAAFRKAWAEGNRESKLIQSDGPNPVNVGYCGGVKLATSQPVHTCEEWRAGQRPKP